MSARQIMLGADKDLIELGAELEGRGYVIARDGRDHFQVYRDGRRVTVIYNTPSGGNSRRVVMGEVKRWERENGLLEQPVRSASAIVRKARKTRARPGMSGFTVPFNPGTTSRPSELEPSQYTVASMLGEEKMRALAATVAQPFQDWRNNPRRQFTDDEKAAMLYRYDQAPAGGKQDALKAMGIYSSNISNWRKQLTGRGYFEKPAVEELVTEALVVAEQAMAEFVTIPSVDPDDEIRELTSQWADLATRKRKLLAERAPVAAKMEELLAQVANLDAELVTTSDELVLVRVRLAELVGEE